MKKKIIHSCGRGEGRCYQLQGSANMKVQIFRYPYFNSDPIRYWHFPVKYCTHCGQSAIEDRNHYCGWLDKNGNYIWCEEYDDGSITLWIPDNPTGTGLLRVSGGNKVFACPNCGYKPNMK